MFFISETAPESLLMSIFLSTVSFRQLRLFITSASNLFQPLPITQFQSYSIFSDITLSAKILFAKTAITIPEVGMTKWQKFIFSVMEAASPLRCWQGCFLFKCLSLACRWLPSCCVIMQAFFCTCAGERKWALVSLTLIRHQPYWINTSSYATV